MKFTYLLIDFFSVVVPFIFSFHPGLKFYKNWPAFFPAMIITGAAFITWDMYFTHLKIWGFSHVYITGIYIGNLPVEEILFFFCIPYACVFTYACSDLLIKRSLSNLIRLSISCFLIALSAGMAVYFHHQLYTVYAFSLLGLLLCTVEFILKAKWLSRFYITYLLLLLPFVIVNGMLTGTGLACPIVWYNPAQITGPRILTIPIEDIFYGMDLILLNAVIYHALLAKSYHTRKSRRKAQMIAHPLTQTPKFHE